MWNAVNWIRSLMEKNGVQLRCPGCTREIGNTHEAYCQFAWWLAEQMCSGWKTRVGGLVATVHLAPDDREDCSGETTGRIHAVMSLSVDGDHTLVSDKGLSDMKYEFDKFVAQLPQRDKLLG